MKAERRHELQTNALAQWLSKTIEQVQPHINAILLVAIAVVAVIAAAVWLSQRGSGAAGSAWEAYYKANGIAEDEPRILELTRVAEDHPGTPAGLWAKLMAADARLVRGTNAAFKDRLEGREDLEKAEAEFAAVIEGAQGLSDSQGQMLLIRATWGLARTHESLAEHEEAIAQYEKIAQQWPDSPFGEAAAEQAEYLKGLDDWFAWYAKVDPKSIKPTQRQSPGGFPGGLPFDHPPVSAPPSGASEEDINLGAGLGQFPGSAPPESSSPDATAPDEPAPDTTEPDTTEPDTTEPDTTEPGVPGDDETDPARPQPDSPPENSDSDGTAAPPGDDDAGESDLEDALPDAP